MPCNCAVGESSGKQGCGAGLLVVHVYIIWYDKADSVGAACAQGVRSGRARARDSRLAAPSADHYTTINNTGLYAVEYALPCPPL